MEVMDIIIKFGGCITALGVISAMVFKGIKSSNSELKSMITDLGTTIKKMDLNQCKTELINFIAETKAGIPKNEIQIKRAHEIYDHYIKDLNGNSYIMDEWQDLKTKGLI